MGLRDDRVLSLLMVIVVEIHDHPVPGALELVRARGVGEQRGEVPLAAVGVQHGKPGLAAGIEAPRRDGGQPARLALFAVLLVHVQQGRDVRSVGTPPGARAAHAPQHAL